MSDVLLIASAAKNRRPGHTGYSPRAFVFGLDDRLVASNLNHFLEEPDDASVEAHKTDPTLNKARQLRKIATKAVIELDQSDKLQHVRILPDLQRRIFFYLVIKSCFGVNSQPEKQVERLRNQEKNSRSKGS